MSVVFPRGPAPVRANLTPLIDVTFLLIVFFALVSQIADTERVRMDLPTPAQAATTPIGDGARVVMNLLTDDESGAPVGYQLGTTRYAMGDGPRQEMMNRLASLYADNPNLAVRVRAPGHLPWPEVSRLLNILRDAASDNGMDSIRLDLAIQRTG